MPTGSESRTCGTAESSFGLALNPSNSQAEAVEFRWTRLLKGVSEADLEARRESPSLISQAQGPL